MFQHPRCSAGFTLLETLIAIGVMAALALTVILVMNPGELLKESRDVTRLSDLRNVHSALKLYEIDQFGFLGTSSVVYVSIPSNQSDCSDLGLPTLPDGWSYNCVTQTNLRKINGLGWIPVNFESITYNSPIARLPTDPINTTTTGNYYTYVTGGSWKLTARFESDQTIAQAGLDGGPDPVIYEQGSNLNLAPFLGGMVGWWSFDETGETALDYSGYANHGTMYSSTTTTDLHTITGCQRGSCGSFDGTDDYVNCGNSTNLNLTTSFTIGVWIYPTRLSGFQSIVFKGTSTTWFNNNYSFGLNSNKIRFKGTFSNGVELDSTTALVLNKWQFVVGVYNKALQQARIYIDGIQDASQNNNCKTPTTVSDNLRIGLVPSYSFQGLISDVRIYNRALTAAEILAIYNATR